MSRGRKGSYASIGKVRRTLRKLEPEITEELKDIVQTTADLVENNAKQNAPVDTGNLRKYITAKVGRDGLTAQVGIRGKRARKKAFYAHFVEFGTRELRAQPFLFPAVEQYKNQFFKKSQSALKRALINAVKKAKTTSTNNE